MALEGAPGMTSNQVVLGYCCRGYSLKPSRFPDSSNATRDAVIATLYYFLYLYWRKVVGVHGYLWLQFVKFTCT